MKHFLTGILTLLITILICLFCVSYCAKDIIVNTLSKEVVESEVTNQITQTIKDVYEDVDYETLEKIETNIANSEELTDVTKKYFDNIVDSIINDKEITIPNTKEDILSIIDQNGELLKENGIEFTSEQKDKLVNELTEDGKLDKVYKNVSSSIKDDMTDKEKSVVSFYDKITNPNFRWIVVGLIVIFTLFIALIKKTYYRWTYNLSVAFFLAAIMLSFILPSIVNSLSIDLTTKFLGKAANININPIINLGYICFAVCALFVIIYIIGNKITNYNNRKYD